jgi:hypothetical protein
MKRNELLVCTLVLGLLAVLAASTGARPGQGISQARETAQWSIPLAVTGTAFTYQGRLTDAEGLVDGTCDFVFRLYDEAGAGIPPAGGTLLGMEEKNDVEVKEGLFVIQLDFGSNVFTGEQRWLEITVDCGSGPTTLSPRQELTPSPYAIHARSAESVPWTGLIDTPLGFADGVDDDTHLSESEVESFVTNGPLDLAGGTTVEGKTLSTLISGGCEAIQAAINDLPPSGGQIIVQAGTYTCTQPIVIDRDNVDLRGQGPATILRLADGANLPLLVLGQTVTPPTLTRRNIHVADLTVDGNRGNQNYECYNNDCAAYPIRNNGITLRRVSDVLVERVTVLGARSGGLVAEKGCRRVAVQNLRAVDSYFDGLAAYETEDSRFSGLYLYNNCAAGLSFDLDFDNNLVGDVIILRDSESRCAPELADGTVGIFMRDSRDNLFHDIQIQNTREHGIFLAQAVGQPDTAAAGNTFSGIVVSGTGGAGLRANDSTVVNTLVVESQFSQNAGGCIGEVTEGQVQVFAVICR